MLSKDFNLVSSTVDKQFDDVAGGRQVYAL
jgi:hypothetical protein